MATSIKELETKAKREKYAKEYAENIQVNNSVSVDTRKMYDGTPYRKTIFIKQK